MIFASVSVSLLKTVRAASPSRYWAMPPNRAASQGKQLSKKTRRIPDVVKDGKMTDGNKIVDIEECCFSNAEVLQARSKLLDWYDANHRVLPWRRNPHSKLAPHVVAAAEKEGVTPAPPHLPLNQFIYWVWVCEIMSQQTQVSRASQYFQRWTQKWPTVEHLARASQEEVNDMWAGLGYYRRARYLLDGAKYVMAELGGSFPTASKELQKIPGVGAYTGNAIASIACGEQVAVVDGNVIRVLARLRAVGGDPRSTAATKLWADLAASLLDPARPGDFNQAMMELGATVCIPNAQPRCAECPVNACCAAYAEVQRYEREGGSTLATSAPRVTNYPAKVEKAEKRQETVAVAVVQLAPPGNSSSGADVAATRFLLVQRPKDGLLAGLWEFPLLPVLAGASRAERQDAMGGYLQQLLGVQLQEGEEGEGAAAASGQTSMQSVQVAARGHLGELVHVFSHIRMTLVVEGIQLQGDLPVLSAAQETGAQGDEGGTCSSDGGCGRGGATLKPSNPPPEVAAAGTSMKAAPKHSAAGSSGGSMQWLTLEELESKGLSSSVRKVLELYKKGVAREKRSVHSMLIKAAVKKKKGTR